MIFFTCSGGENQKLEQLVNHFFPRFKIERLTARPSHLKWNMQCPWSSNFIGDFREQRDHCSWNF